VATEVKEKLMAIDSRGAQGTLVLSKSGVPVYDVADAIITEYNVEWICKRYPITPAEVFEVAEAMSDLLQDWDNGLEFRNAGTETDVTLETIKVSDTVFFNLISYGRAIAPHVENFDQLYRLGLVEVVKDLYQALKDNKLHEVAEPNGLHSVVYDALYRILGDVNPDQVLNIFKDKK
jgi:uncharacterized protein (DUF433 family)